MSFGFKKATDELLWTFSHSELAAALGVSIATVRQARLDQGARAHRKAPEEWESVVARLAKERGTRLLRLSEALKGGKKTARTNPLK